MISTNNSHLGANERKKSRRINRRLSFDMGPRPELPLPEVAYADIDIADCLGKGWISG